ncbi:beta-galactosidase 1-like protein [Gorgonomyces haynaldii]|nr:beta-galactosidase 1-like protein [Gorgonomyces haynaldii]
MKSKQRKNNQSVLLLVILLLLFVSLPEQRSVGYDHRSILINQKRELLLVGHIHYPRSTPDMWPQLFQSTKEAGINTIDTYVFWNEHESVRGQYDFNGNRDLRHFIQLAQEHGLYVVLRIGPYVCAEYNYGGFPVWLREIEGIDMRNYNQQFMTEMQKFVEYVVDLTRDLMHSQGGPIILLQIENEYGNVQRDYSHGQEYIEWAVDMALNTTKEQWLVCQQFGTVSQVLDTCNGFYCDNWIESRPYKHQPAMHVEHWTGWFMHWGELRPQRPAEDIAFSVARFIQKGGTYTGYYMWHGGTNFGRTSGGPGITTSYDYDAPLDEYGSKNEPKYSHLKQLHKILLAYKDVILYGHIQKYQVQNHVQAVSYGSRLLFLSNDGLEDVHVAFQDKFYLIPRWSVLLINQRTKKILFDTASVNAPTTKRFYAPIASVKSALEFKEPFGFNGIQSKLPLEQIQVTRDTTDYLWYITNLTSSEVQIDYEGDYVTVYVDGILQLQGTQVSTLVTKGKQLQIRSQTMGLINFGSHFERYTRGLKSVRTGNSAVENWLMQSGLRGEHVQVMCLRRGMAEQEHI